MTGVFGSHVSRTKALSGLQCIDFFPCGVRHSIISPRFCAQKRTARLLQIVRPGRISQSRYDYVYSLLRPLTVSLGPGILLRLAGKSRVDVQTMEGLRNLVTPPQTVSPGDSGRPDNREARRSFLREPLVREFVKIGDRELIPKGDRIRCGSMTSSCPSWNGSLHMAFFHMQWARTEVGFCHGLGRGVAGLF